MAYQQRLLFSNRFLENPGTVSLNLYGFSISIYASILASLSSVSEEPIHAEEQADSPKEKPNDRFSYGVPISIGELCNTSVYDDSASKALEDLIKRVLGVRAADRFSELRRIKARWDFGKGEALSEGAVKNLSALLSRVKNAPPNIRLFLCSDGSLEIQWKSPEGERTSVFLKDDGFEVLHPEHHEEQAFSDSDFQGVLLNAGLV